MTGESIGIIYPPPELRNIVDKTASFVARNGPEFESRIQQNEQNNPKFNFLKGGDPYHAYYQHKVKEFKDGTKGGDISAPPSSSTIPSNHQTMQTQQTKMSKQLEHFVETALIPREPPPDFEFISDPPSISALDLDIVKLTAQFVAIHGRSFLTNLMNREQRNYQFDFLRPQHGLFSYFTQLIEQYSKIVMPSMNLLNDLKKEVREPKSVLEKIKYRVEWNKIREAEKRREQEEAEKERIQYAQIDWHDFVVVETVDYQPHEQGIFPPPTTPEQVGSRILLQQRIEEQGQDAMEMDVESDEEDNEGKKNEENVQNENVKEAMPPPLPPQLDNVLIRKDYNPKAAKAAAPQPAQPSKVDSWVISPITGEKIPAEKLQEHMRYGLLDSRWVEQRERAIQEKMEQEDVYAPGSAIESSLKQMAERRTDIFGSGDEETVIGKKIGEEETKKPEKVTWDGYTASMEAATRAARANITIQDQIQQIHKMKGLLPEDDKDKIGPTLPAVSTSMVTAPSLSTLISTPSTSSMTQQIFPKPATSNMVPNIAQHPSTTTHQHIHPNIAQQLRPHQLMHQTHGHQQILLQQGNQQMPSGSPYMVTPSPMMVGVYGLGLSQNPELAQHGMNPMLHVQGLQPMPQMTLPNLVNEEPASKKLKGEESLMSEEEFVKLNPGPVTFNVQVPSLTDKPEWTMQGQLLSINLPITDMVSVIKAKIFEQTNMPPGKQKLQYDGIFIKDSNTLAFYNITKGATITLGLKERGGRKK